MKNIFSSIVFFILILFVHSGLCQEQPKDTVKEALPRLEIPEITIIGKKAITLPFARKGEIYDVNIYHAGPPDSSLFGKGPTFRHSVLSLPKYEERISPLHISVDGMLGSFSYGRVNGFADYQGHDWGIAGNGGYGTTQGHTANALSSGTSGEVQAYSILRTDNDVLNTLRASAHSQFAHDSYGMFGIPGSPVERRRNNFEFSSQLRSLDQERNAIDVSVGTSMWTVHDVRAGVDSQISSVSPDLQASFTTGIKDARLLAGVSYVSSSLEYSVSTQSPSLFTLFATSRWRASSTLSLTIGGNYSNGTGIQGSGQTLVSPIATATVTIDRQSEFSVWWKPEQRLSTYSDLLQQNPYFVRELKIQPEKKTINVGGSVSHSDDLYRMEVSAEYSQSTNKGIVLSDKGNVAVEFVDAEQLVLQFNGSITPSHATRLTVECTIEPSHEKGNTLQLPMVPLARLHGKGELNFNFPLTLWSSLEYWSQQNVDRLAHRELGGTMLIGVGGSTTVVPKTVLSLEMRNLFNTSYEWWSGYVAPGRQMTIRAQVNLQ